MSNKTTTDLVLFWRQTDPKLGYLSQWYLANITEKDAKNITYSCNEQYMMYKKALLMGDKETAQKILESGENARRIRDLGRKVKNWEQCGAAKIVWDVPS